MDRSTADGLAGGGALLAAVSLLLPWYSIEVGSEMAAQAGVSPRLGNATGWETLGDLRWVILALALAAGLRATRGIRREVSLIGALGLVALVGYRFSSPPAFGDAVAQYLPSSGDAFTDGFSRALLTSFSERLGFELVPAIGMGVAALGAGMALWGALTTAE